MLEDDRSRVSGYPRTQARLSCKQWSDLGLCTTVDAASAVPKREAGTLARDAQSKYISFFARFQNNISNAPMAVEQQEKDHGARK